MRQVIISLVCISLLFACNQGSEKAAETKVESESSSISYPYKPNYSSDIKIGDANHSKIVLDFFKKWEENKLDEMRAMLADSVKVEFPDGEKLDLTADSLMKIAKDYRSKLSSLKITVDAWMPIHINDKNEDFVLVWENDYTVDANGKADSTRTHSYWQIKNNKISHWSEFNQKLTPPPPMEKPKTRK